MFEFILATAAAGALNISVDMHNVERNGDVISAIFQVTSTSTENYSSVFVECAFLNSDKRAVDVGKAYLQHLPAGGKRYGKVAILRASGDVMSAKCYVGSAR